MNCNGKKRTALSTLCLPLILFLVFLSAGRSVYASAAANETAYAQTENAEPEYTSLDEIAGKKIGMTTGFDTVLKGALTGDNEFVYYLSVTDSVIALNTGKVDCVCVDEPVARLAVRANEGLCIMPETLAEAEYGIAFPKNSPYLSSFNTVIKRFWEDGTIEALEKKWMDRDENETELIPQDWEGKNGTIRYYHDSAYSPMCYIGKGGKSAGYDLDLVLMVAKELDLRVEMTVCDYDALVPAIQSGKADIASGCMDITEEKKQFVDFSEPYCKSAVVLIVHDQNFKAPSESFGERLKRSFYSTFIEDNRWKMILDGLGITVLISVLSGIIGLVMGFGVCMLRRMRQKAPRAVAAAYIKIVQGMPIVVFLMILFYVIFGSTDISGIVVAVIGFSINFSAYTSEMIRSGLDTVEKGQSEAAFAMGYTRMQTFWKIIFPQAATRFLPVLKGEFISMVKMTSVVGYIAVQDLTKVSDLIRSRTMDAFFPLIATAVIYFLIANLLTGALTYAERRFDPKRGKRKVKGVPQ